MEYKILKEKRILLGNPSKEIEIDCAVFEKDLRFKVLPNKNLIPINISYKYINSLPKKIQQSLINGISYFCEANEIKIGQIIRFNWCSI